VWRGCGEEATARFIVERGVDGVGHTVNDPLFGAIGMHRADGTTDGILEHLHFADAEFLVWNEHLAAENEILLSKLWGRWRYPTLDQGPPGGQVD